MTSPLSTELLRHCLLRQLAASLPASLTPETLLIGLHTGGFSTNHIELSAELLYLTQRGLIEPITKATNPAPRYRLTANGRDYLQTEGLL
jgi:hypothetical protein